MLDRQQERSLWEAFSEGCGLSRFKVTTVTLGFGRSLVKPWGVRCNFKPFFKRGQLQPSPRMKLLRGGQEKPISSKRHRLQPVPA
jgi:hypothetical protein